MNETVTNFDIGKISHEDLKKGRYRQFIPEIYTLKNTVENNAWHLNQNVFDHTVLVLKNMENLLASSFNGNVNKMLSSKIGKNKRRNLLRIFALYHDIGKPQTIVKNENGTTSCPNHEAVGANIAVKYLTKFPLDKDEIEYLRKLITLHTIIIDYLKKIDNENKKDHALSKYKERVGDLYVELMFLFHSDLLGSDLKKSKPNEYGKFKSAVEDLINSV